MFPITVYQSTHHHFTPQTGRSIVVLQSKYSISRSSNHLSLMKPEGSLLCLVSFFRAMQVSFHGTHITSTYSEFLNFLCHCRAHTQKTVICSEFCSFLGHCRSTFMGHITDTGSEFFSFLYHCRWTSMGLTQTHTHTHTTGISEFLSFLGHCRSASIGNT